MKLLFSLFLLSVLCSSCATIFNSKRTSLKIITKTSGQIVVNGEKQESSGLEHKIVVQRSEQPIELTVSNDTFAKSVHILPKKSFAYWLNAVPWTLGVGFILDKNQIKRFSYPKKVYILDDTSNIYYDHNPIKKPFDQYSNILKVSPIFIFAPINPAIELSYERRTGKRFGTQVNVSYLLPKQVVNMSSGFPSDIKGFRISLEEKIYFKQSSPKGAYLGIEIDYLNNKYRDEALFGEASSIYDSIYYDNTYIDEFSVNKQTLSFNLKIGYQVIRKRFALDFSFGIGARYKITKHINRLNPDDNMVRPQHPNSNLMSNFYYISSEPGKYWTISVPLNFRIGWRF